MGLIRVLGILALTGSVLFSATRSVAQRFDLVQRFTSANGLPQNSITALELDAAGFLWITTDGGVVRFDGNSVKQVLIGSTNAPISSRTRNIARTENGKIVVDDGPGDLYMVKQNGLAEKFEGDTFNLFRSCLRSTARLNGHVLRWYAGKYQSRKWVEPYRVTSLDADEWVTMVNRDLIFYRDSSETSHLTIPKGIASSNEILEPEHLFYFDGILFITDRVGSIFALDKERGTFHRVVTVNGSGSSLSLGRIEVFTSRKGQVLLMGPDGLYLLVRGALSGNLNVRRLDVDPPEETRITDVAYMEEQGAIVFGTISKGLFVCRERTMRTISCSSDNSDVTTSFYAQVELEPGKVLTVNHEIKSVIITDDDCYSWYPVEVLYKGLARVDTNTVALNLNGELFFYHIREGAFKSIVKGVKACTFLVEGDTLFVGSNQGIGTVEVDGVQWLEANLSLDEPDRPIVMCRDVDGVLWYGSCSGLYKAVDRSLSKFHSIAEFEGMCVRNLERIGDRLFIGTYGHGAFMFRKGVFHKLPMDPNNSLIHTHSFFLDDNGSFWLSTNHGLLRTTLADLDLAISVPTTTPYFAIYDELSGLTTGEFNGGCQPARIRLSNGELSYPTIEGIVRFVPEDELDPFPSGVILLESVRVDGSESSGSGPLKFGPDVKEIIVRFALPYWGDPRNARLEYRLPGVKDDWELLPTNARELRILRPHSGNYRLSIRKVGSAVRPDPRSLDVDFSVAPVFFRTGLGIMLLICLLLLIAFALIRLRTRNVVRKNRTLQDQVDVRTAELLSSNAQLVHANAHNEKLISIISHDIVPPMQFVARVARSANDLHLRGDAQQGLGGTLMDLSTSTDNLYHNASNLLTWVRTRSLNKGPQPRNVSVLALVEECMVRVKEMAALRKITLRVDIDPDDLLRTDPDLLAIAINNLIQNAIIHGRVSQIQLQGAFTNDHYRLILSDNGKGMSADVLKQVKTEFTTDVISDPDRRGPKAGLGSVIIGECIRNLRASIMVSSGTEGTRFEILLPLDIQKGTTVT